MMAHLKEICHKEVVKCPLEDQEGAATFTLGQLKEHLKTCPKLFAKCQNCSEQMAMEKKKDHTFSHCIANLIKEKTEKAEKEAQKVTKSKEEEKK